MVCSMYSTQAWCWAAYGYTDSSLSTQQHAPLQLKLGVLALGAATFVAVVAGSQRDPASPGEA